MFFGTAKIGKLSQA